MKARLINTAASGRRVGGARISTLLAAIAVALALTAPADAATGPHNHVEATCFAGSRIVVTSPAMSPAYSTVVLPNGALIGDPPQWVAFRVHVERWNGYSWSRWASSPWKASVVTYGSSNIADTWLNLSTNRWEAGTTVFPIRASGYYRVAAEYHWYPVYGQPGGHVGPLVTPFHSANGYMGWGDPWCRF